MLPSRAWPSGLRTPQRPRQTSRRRPALSSTRSPVSRSSIATAGATTNLSFAFREDAAFLELDNVSLIDLTNPSGNLVVNGDFEAGPFLAQAPTGWTYLNIFGVGGGGRVQIICGNPGNCYFDGAVQAYDSITQAIATMPGDLYQLSYDYTDVCGSCGTVYQPLSTNGQPGTSGNGRDMFVYANALPVPAPEPASLALLGTALAGFGWLRRHHKA